MSPRYGVCADCGSVNDGRSVRCMACELASRASRFVPTVDSARQRFMAKVDKSTTPDGCWPWTGARNRDGYGWFAFGKKKGGAHRFALLLDGRLLTDGQIVCHHCDNPPCVRPSHLYAGTLSSNMRDAFARGRKTPPNRWAVAS